MEPSIPCRLKARIASRAQRNIPRKVHIDHILPLLQCHLVHVGIQLYGGVGHANIDPAEALQHAIEHGLYISFAGDISLEDHCFSTVFLDDCSGFSRSLLVRAVIHQDVCAGSGKPDCHCLAEALASSRHQSLLSHQHPMYGRRWHLIRRRVSVFGAHQHPFTTVVWTAFSRCSAIWSLSGQRSDCPFR
jgi:hypothetical protein